MFSPEKLPPDSSHLPAIPPVEDPERAGGIVEGFDNGESGATLLLQGAVRLGDVERMRTALHAGASLEAKDAWGLAPLHAAVIVGSVEGVTLLIKHDASVDALSTRGQTALHLAAAEGKDDMIMLLLGFKADVALPTDFGSTPISIAERRRRVAAVAASAPPASPSQGELAILAELQRRLRDADVEVAEKRRQVASATESRELLQAQLGTMLENLRSARQDVADDQVAEGEDGSQQPSKQDGGDFNGDAPASLDQPSAEILNCETNGALPETLPDADVESLASTSPVGNAYEYWRATSLAIHEARGRGEDALLRSWQRKLPTKNDFDPFTWSGPCDGSPSLPMPDPEDDDLVAAFEWLQEVAEEEKMKHQKATSDPVLLDRGESLVQRTRDEAMIARTGNTQFQWESLVNDLKDESPWDWSKLEVRQRSAQGDGLSSAGVFAVGPSEGEVVFEPNDIIGPLGGLIRRRARYEQTYYPDAIWMLHDPACFEMSLYAQTADLKTEPLVMDLGAGASQNRLRYLSDMRLDPMGLREQLGIRDITSTRPVLPARQRMPRPRSRPGSPEAFDRTHDSRTPTPQAMQAQFRDFEGSANTMWAEVLIEGWPHVFVVATRQILVGEELTVDYGEDYWAAQRALFSRFLNMGRLGDETVVRVNGVERESDAYRESLSVSKDHWQSQKDRLLREWK